MDTINNTKYLDLSDKQINEYIKTNLSEDEYKRVQNGTEFFIPRISVGIDTCDLTHDSTSPQIQYHVLETGDEGSEYIRRNYLFIRKETANDIERQIASNICLYNLKIDAIENNECRNMVKEMWIRLLVPKIKIPCLLLSFIAEFYNQIDKRKRMCNRCCDRSSNLYEGWYYSEKNQIMCQICKVNLFNIYET